jgi:hypothetical protein
MFLVSWGAVRRVHLVRRPLFGLLYQPRLMDDDEYGAITGMIGRRNRRTRRSAPLLRFPPQIPHDLTRARTRATAVWSERLTAWATERFITQSKIILILWYKISALRCFWQIPYHGSRKHILASEFWDMCNSLFFFSVYPYRQTIDVHQQKDNIKNSRICKLIVTYVSSFILVDYGQTCFS